jgi:hypothetical protein
VFAAVVFISGCGYHFAASGDVLPQDAKTIYVERFGNNTRITGINDQFMRYVKDEIALHKRLTVVDSPDGADLQLSGQIKLFIQAPVNFNSALEPTQYSQDLIILARLEDLHTDKIIWSTHNLGSLTRAPIVAQNVTITTPTFLQQNLRSQNYERMTDLQTAQAQTAMSQDTMMQRLAASLYTEMAEGF